MPIRDLENWMWAEACEMLDRADRMHRQLFRPTAMNVKRATWEPPVDVYETPYECKIVIALPGVLPEHLNVALEGVHLVVQGKRHPPSSAEAQIRRLEIPYGRFERWVELPLGQYKIDTREFEHGCLVVSLRKI